MKKQEEKFEKSCIGNDLKIGTRPDGSMFWLKTDGKKLSKGEDYAFLEGGTAWIDKKTDTTILSYPTNNSESFKKMKKEFCEQSGWALAYTGSEYYAILSECELNVPTIIGDHGPLGTDDYYKDSEYEDTGYILGENTFVLKNSNDGKLFYLQYSDYSKDDFYKDRFGWINALKRLFPDKSDEELFERLYVDFMKESYGDLWIDEENSVLVLGPIVEQPPEILDEYLGEHISKLYNSLPLWDKTKYWTEIDPNLKRTPVSGKMFYLWGCFKLCGN